MAALLDATGSQDLVSTSPVTSERDPARLLRNGLAAVSYAAFEDFFVSRTAEALGAFDGTRVSFRRLPDKLKEAATLGAVRAMNFRVGFEEASVRLKFVQEHANFVHSTSMSMYRFSPLTFSPYSTNLTSDDFERALKAVVVDSPWPQLASIATRVGYGVVGLRERIAQLLAQRNEAAHSPAADISVADLKQLPHDLLAAALAFDAVFCRAITLICRRDVSSDPNERILNVAKDISIVFLDQAGARIKEVQEGRDRAARVYSSLEEALAGAVTRASPGKALVVVRDAQGRPIDWRVTDF
ncbi:hypothetical protein AB0J27_19050 [Micromonospora chokoriensis]